MKLVCAPPKHPSLSEVPRGTPCVMLFGRSLKAGVISTGLGILQKIDHRRLAPAPRAWDLLSVALAVNAADQSLPRSMSPDGWTREIELEVAVQDQKFWNSKRVDLDALLRFLTTDIWKVSFLDGGQPAPEAKSLFAPREDSACLLSGGLDSLAGAIDLAARGRKLLAVSQVAAGDKTHQAEFAERIGSGLYHLQLNHNAHGWAEGERSQRARSLVFLAYGLLAATCLQAHRNGNAATLFVPENGFISINPPLTPDRLGSLSTRTTHPVFMTGLQELVASMGLRIKIENPFQFETKGEALRRCRRQPLLRELASSSTSCGRFARNAFTHCGRCVPCLIRRASFHRWGQADETEYRYEQLSRQDRKHALFDDVRSMQIAIEAVRAHGAPLWMGQTLSSKRIDDPGKYAAVVERGLKEVRAFLRAQGLR
ncbi:MAG: Qat anti-phage system QueC-like protein QatC [Phycisphaerales bacterium]